LLILNLIELSVPSQTIFGDAETIQGCDQWVCIWIALTGYLS